MQPPAIAPLIRALDPGRCLWEVGYRAALLGVGVALALHGSTLLLPVAFVCIGVLQYHFLILSHEAQHSLIASNRRRNDLIGAWCFAYPFGQPFHSERRRHFAHHRLVGDPADPDFQRYRLDDKRPWVPLLLYYVRLAGYGKFLEYVSSALRRRGSQEQAAPGVQRSAGELALVAAVQLAILGGFTLVASPLHYVAFWLLPLWVVASPLSEFRELCEHVSAPATPLHLKTFRAPAWQRFVIGPVGFSYHAEHHFYPSIPHYRLRDAAALFPESTADFEVHQSYFDVLRKCRVGAATPAPACA